MKILFITRRSSNCGVADYGKRLFSILKPEMDIALLEVDSADQINYSGYDIALYNYHHATLPFITCEDKSIKHVALFHEAFQNIQPDTWISVSELPRPLYPFAPDIKYPMSMNDPDYLEYMDKLRKKISNPEIGSFGFGFPDKNFEGIVKMVKREFTSAVINLHIPFAEFGDSGGTMAIATARACKDITTDHIAVHVSHEYKSPEQLVHWLSLNDLNIFNCIPTHGRGISSSIDYALSARRPIGISNSEMYRHLPREICIDNISLPRLIAKGIEPLRHIYDGNTHEKLIEAVRTKLGF